MHERITEEFILFTKKDKRLKTLIKKSLKQAKKINPDKNTNPAQSLRSLYKFLDWSAKCLPWQCLKKADYPSLYKRIDQCTGYFWFIFDQPLKELENMGFYYPSLQYVEPIASWIKKYSRVWGEFLSKPESWNENFHQLFLQDESFGLKSGIYEDAEWNSFNDFFARKLKSNDVRPIANTDVVSPADSYPSSCENYGLNAFMPSLGGYRDGITYETWEKIFDENFRPLLNKDTIVLAQSIGTQFIVKYLAKNKLEIGCYISCAAPYNATWFREEIKEAAQRFVTAAKTFIPNEQEYEAFRNLPFKKYSFYSNNDCFFEQSNLEKYSQAINSVPTLLPNKSHFSVDGGDTQLKEVEDFIKSLI